MLSFSTKISNPLSIKVLAVLGVKADLRSCSFFSHLNQRGWLTLPDEVPAEEGRGAAAAEVDWAIFVCVSVCVCCVDKRDL